MRTRFRSKVHCHAQVASVSPALLLWKLHKSQGMLHGHCGSPPTEWKPHRPCPDGHRPFVELSAIYNWSVSSIDGRPAKAFCSNQFWQQQRAKHGLAMYFKQCLHQPHSLSCLWLKEGWSSILGPSIAHFNAWWPKKPRVPFQCRMKCT
mgnify:CR=1 FL=1